MCSLKELGLRNEESSVAASIKYGPLHLFVVPWRYAHNDPNTAFFHSVGGRCLKTETFLECLYREVDEEIGEHLIVVSAHQTRLITSDHQERIISVADVPRPLWLYRKTSISDESFHHNDVNWLIGYQATIMEKPRKPKSEIAVLMMLSDEMLRRSLAEPISYRQIAGGTDGSEVIVREGLSFDFSKLARPTGLAAILARSV